MFAVGQSNCYDYWCDIYDTTSMKQLLQRANVVFVGVIMILGSSMEFEKGHNNEIVMRITDNEELPMVSKYT